MSSPLITVLLCTRNPQPSFLRRTLEGLKAQTLPILQWQLLLLDNASHPPLGAEWRPDWHPNGDLVRVDAGGKTDAIRLGLSRATSELVCTVDDDNVLQPDYLHLAVAAFREHKRLGVAGGRIRGEYETAPPAGIERYLAHLAIRDFGDKPRIATGAGLRRWTPCGAGMVMRRDALDTALVHVAEFARTFRRNRGDDTCLALDIAAQGFASAYLPQLELTHLIPAHRLQPDYIELLVRVSTLTVTAFLIRGGMKPAASRWRQLAKNLMRGVYNPTPAGALKRRMERARRDSQDAILGRRADISAMLRDLESRIAWIDGRGD